jgi:HTH-type transcriptional regulator, sugar sensing transcriptional regulator
MNINTLFPSINFSENKTKIYLAILSLGTAPVSAIAKKAGIVRSTTYKILGELIKEGLVEIGEGKVKKFTALHPSSLVEAMENKKKAVENYLPELLGIYSTSSFKPYMRFYEGEVGKKKVFEDILTLHEDVVYTFSPMKEVLNLFGKTYTRHYMEKRVKNKIWRHALRPATDINQDMSDWEFYGSNEKLMREIRFLPKEISYDTLIQIYADKVAVVASEKENYAFIVESKELASLMKQVFLWLWATAKK